MHVYACRHTHTLSLSLRREFEESFEEMLITSNSIINKLYLKINAYNLLD